MLRRESAYEVFTDMRIIIAAADVTCLSDNPATYEKAYNLITNDRQKKADRLKGENDKRRCVASGILLNYLLKMWSQSVSNVDNKAASDNIHNSNKNILSVNLQEIVDNYDTKYNYETTTIANGKPIFKDYPDIHFNISHSGKYVVCAVADTPVGVDIEGSRPIKGAVAKRFYSDEENEWVSAAETPSLQEQRFFRLWTLKEAYAKATGEGIALSISKAKFKVVECNEASASKENVTNINTLIFADRELENQYDIAEFGAISGYRVAVIYKNCDLSGN